MDSWNFPDTAARLADYFHRQDQTRDEFLAGAKAADAWSEALASPDPSATDLRHLEELIDAGAEDDGTGWVELRMAFNAWHDAGRRSH